MLLSSTFCVSTLILFFTAYEQQTKKTTTMIWDQIFCTSKNVFPPHPQLPRTYLYCTPTKKQQCTRRPHGAKAAATTVWLTEPGCVVPSFLCRPFLCFNWRKQIAFLRHEGRIATVELPRVGSRPIQVTWARWADNMTFMNDKYKRAPTPVGVRLNPFRLLAS